MGKSNHISVDNITDPIDYYVAIGGERMCRKLAAAFYARVPLDPVLRSVYPASSHCAVDILGAYFVQLFGGPNEYSRRRYWMSLREAHARFRIGEAEREAWLRTMCGALGDIEIDEALREILVAFFERSSADMINQPAAQPPVWKADAARPAGFAGAIACRWELQHALDAIVAAIRVEDHALALSLAGAPAFQEYLRQDRAAFAGLLAEMAGSGVPELATYVQKTIREEPELVHSRYYNGRTLLHTAAGNGNVELVEFLIGLGGDPNARDEYGHTPLYTAGNAAGTEEVVHALARAGADMDAQDHVKGCAALHMAARRGNVPVALALLDSGANIELRDRNGETPLRRAVNCGKPQIVALLLSRGANPNSQCKKGLTPCQVARTATMKQLFESHELSL